MMLQAGKFQVEPVLKSESLCQQQCLTEAFFYSFPITYYIALDLIIFFDNIGNLYFITQL